MSRRIEKLRGEGAAQLYGELRSFVSRVNALTTKTGMTLDPEGFDASLSREDEHIFQMHVRGRILMFTFGPTREMIETEDCRDPYILQGYARSFNQELLESESIEEHPVFYCIDCPMPGWRYFKSRTYQTGRIDEDYLASIFEALL